MHEVHLVRAIVDTVQHQAAARSAKRVTLVRIQFNPLTSHSADHVQFSFDLVKQDSDLLREARLQLTEVPPRVRCGRCGFEFETDRLPNLCPKCDSPEVTASQPTEMVLEGFEIEG